MSNESSDFAEVQFSAASLRSRWWWIVLGLVLGALAPALFVYSQPETNRSWSQVLVRPLGVDLTRGAVDINRAIDETAERELAGSFIVAERAADRLGGSIDARTLRRNIDISGTADAPVLEFSYADEDAALARDVAQAVAQSYLDVRAELAAETVASSRGSLAAQQAELISQRQELVAARTDELSDEDRLASLSAESLVSNQITELSNSIASLDALTSDPGTIISPAQLAEQSERPRLAPTVIAGTVLGGLVALLAAVFLARRSDDAELDDEGMSALGLTPLGHLQRDVRSVDAFHGIDRRLGELLGDRRVVTIAELGRVGGGTQIASWYAWNLASTGKRVLLVSADFDGKSIARQLGFGEATGLIDALVSGTPAEQAARKSGDLEVVTAGTHPADPSGVLQMVGMNGFLRDARSQYDRIVLAVPDLNNAESSLLATWAADGVVVVVDDHEPRELERAQSLVARTDAELLGSIMLTDAVL